MLYQIRYDAGVGVTASNLDVSKDGWNRLVVVSKKEGRKIARLIYKDLGKLDRFGYCSLQEIGRLLIWYRDIISKQ